MVLLVSFYALFSPHPAAPEHPFALSDKLVHATLFGLLAATTRRRFGSSPGLLVAVAGYAAASELVQWVALPTRDGDVLDLTADLLGAALGWALARSRGTARR